jgi:hypothetical protein
MPNIHSGSVESGCVQSYCFQMFVGTAHENVGILLVVPVDADADSVRDLYFPEVVPRRVCRCSAFYLGWNPVGREESYGNPEIEVVLVLMLWTRMCSGSVLQCVRGRDVVLKPFEVTSGGRS